MPEDPELGMEKEDPPRVVGQEFVPPFNVHGESAHHRRLSSGMIRLGSLDNLRWNAGNREGGREDEGSLHSSRSRSESREGSRRAGSAFGGSKHGGSNFDLSKHGGSHNGGSKHGGSHYGGSKHGGAAYEGVAAGSDLERSFRTGSNNEGSRHGASRLREGSHHGGHAHHGVHVHHHPAPTLLYPNGTSPFHELPGQGGPLQDGAGLSMSSLRATSPYPPPPDSSEDKSDKGVRPRGCWPFLRHHVFSKLRGQLDTAHPRPSHWWGLIVMPLGAFLGILYVSGVDKHTLPDIDMHVLAPTFGASAVLLFSVPESKLSQPRNFLGGQFLSSVVGCTVRQIFPQHLSWVAAPVGVALAVFVMLVTRTVHPPGGATALMCASLQPKGRWAGWIYVPAIMIGSIGMQIIALVMNLITPGRAYPTFWWGSDNFFGGL